MNFIADKNYWVVVGRKVVETLISVKIWVIFSIMATSTWLLLHTFIDGTVWGTVNTAVISTVIVVREGFKIKRNKNKYYVEDLNENNSGKKNDSVVFD